MPYNKLTMEKRIKATFKKIEGNIYKKIGDLAVRAWLTKEPVSFEERLKGSMKELLPGDNWGALFDCAWFNFKGEIPDTFKDQEVVLIVDLSGEGLIVDETGSPVQGITTVASLYDFSLGMPGKKVVYIKNLVKDGRTIDIWVDAGNNDLFGRHQNNGTLAEAYIALCNTEMRALYYDFEVLNELRMQLDADSAQYSSIFFALYKASNVMEEYTEKEASTARSILAVELGRRNIDSPIEVSAIGHAHIDLAWLWPIRESIRKGARTFSTALMNMERYPGYIFGASQPQLYQWTRDNYPSLYERIKERVAEGRWEVQGGMWVESDTNVPSGESLVRQLLYGKKFFKEEFGIEVKNLWLPDVFGYSAVLPQLLKKSDIDYFMTIKLSWSEFNEFPHHTFIWKGIDGSEVLAHMPPEGNYNSSGAPRAIKAIEKKYKDKGVSENCLLLFGIGDGGGGPGEEHIERITRERELKGLLPVKQEKAADFFEKLNSNYDEYKTWNGELYLEHHRGTYTSEGNVKAFNRRLELLLRELEMLLIMENAKYPFDEIEEIWKEVLLYQFHDILPGDSIERVVIECLARYEILENKVRGMISKAVHEDVQSTNLAKVYNTLSWDRSEWVNFKGVWKHALIPALSGQTINFDSSEDIFDTMSAKDNCIENSLVKVTFDESGYISSILDKENNREVLKEGKTANNLQFFIDEGDAWDFPHDYRMHSLGTPSLVEFKYETDGPKAWRRNVYSFGKSTITQKVILTARSRRIDIWTNVDWKETHVMLRTEFPLGVKSPEITCGIQYGYIRRPNHRNTSHDMAKLEICANGWVDISQPDYGVSVMSDYKYGYTSEEDTIDICLLRSATDPNIEGDHGIHEFTYSIYPHTGDHLKAKVIQECFRMQTPLSVHGASGEINSREEPFIGIDADNIIIDAIKRSEDGQGFIVRMFESHGCCTDAVVRFFDSAVCVQETNLIERPVGKEYSNTDEIKLSFSPFEIKTLKVIR